MSSKRFAILRYVEASLVVASLCFGCTAAAMADGTGFEPPDYMGSATGITIWGQNGWYNPLPGLSSDQFVFTYDGNVLGVPANAFGDTQFLGAQALGDTTFPRAQIDYNWGASTVWTVSYDICAGYNGNGTAQDNLSSFSLQDSSFTRSFIALNQWADPGNTWNANYSVYDSTGTQNPTYNAGDAWSKLAVGNWYRQSTTFDLSANTVLSVSIMDLSTGNSTTYVPTGWYLNGGANSQFPLPTALRFFVGGGIGGDPGNVMAFDNLDIEPGAAPVGGDASDAPPKEVKVKANTVTD
jgi:hypothetical protein